jgi:predicted RNA-binding protein with PUA-like domain
MYPGICVNEPMRYLLKTEPSVYSFSDLQRDGSTVWDGVTNPVAVKHLRGMKPGDQLVIYHTGDEKSAVGTASVVAIDASDPKTPLVTIKAGKAIAKPLTLAEIKGQSAFADSPLVRQGRLSVVPLDEAQHKLLLG